MGQQFQNLVELCDRSCERYQDRPLFGQKRNGSWLWTTYGQFHRLVDRCRGGLARYGIGAGDRVAIVANNRIEWAVAAYATYGLGAAYVPMYRAQRPKEWEFILRDCEAKLVLTADTVALAAVEEMKPRLPSLRHVLGLELTPHDDRSWSTLLANGDAAPTPVIQPDPDSIAGFIYTSGTTGLPKGAMLSHRNIASNISALHQVFTFDPEDRSLSFLPWAHSYGQTAEVHGLISMGCSVAICSDPTKLLEELAEVQPTILVAVPRIFNRIYDAVTTQIDARPGVVRKIIRGGVRGAIKRAHGEHLGALESLELGFDERMVFKKIRDKFGGKLKYAISASATLGLEVAEFIDALGLTVYEGYGLTETSPIVSANYPGHRKLGSVGQVLPGIRVDIDRSVTGDPKIGEIVVHGPNVLVGYHNRPEENAKALTADHGLRTGDLGYVDDDGYLWITGRQKEQYKLENGKYVMPGPIEERFKLSHFIGNVMLYGDGRPYNVALVVPNQAALDAWAKERGWDLKPSFRDLRVHALIRDELAAYGQDLKGYERPREILVLNEDFTVENGLLTPTLKLRRNEVVARYRSHIETLYGRPPRESHAP